MVTIGQNYFETARCPSVARDVCSPTVDGTPGRGAAIVNERFAAVHFPAADAIGQRIQFPG